MIKVHYMHVYKYYNESTHFAQLRYTSENYSYSFLFFLLFLIDRIVGHICGVQCDISIHAQNIMF
jgi:hypothetical protein